MSFFLACRGRQDAVGGALRPTNLRLMLLRSPPKGTNAVIFATGRFRLQITTVSHFLTCSTILEKCVFAWLTFSVFVVLLWINKLVVSMADQIKWIIFPAG